MNVFSACMNTLTAQLAKNLSASVSVKKFSPYTFSGRGDKEGGEGEMQREMKREEDQREGEGERKSVVL